MAMHTAFCKSGNFDSIDPVEMITDAPTGRAGPSLPGRSDPRALFSGREFSRWAVQPDREALCKQARARAERPLGTCPFRLAAAMQLTVRRQEAVRSTMAMAAQHA